MPNIISGFSAGANVVQNAQRLNLQKRQLMGEESDRALRERVQGVQTRLINEQIAGLNAERQRKAAQDAALKSATTSFEMSIVNDMPVEEALLTSFGPVAAMTGSSLDDVMRAAVSLRTEKLEGPLQRDRIRADINRIDATTSLTQAREVALDDDKTFAPTVTEKDYAAFLRAESEGDAVGMDIFGKKLGLHGLDEIDKGRFRAELDAIRQDPLISIDPKAKQAALDAVEKKFRAKSGRSGQGTRAPAQDLQSTRSQIVADHKSGKLDRETALKLLRDTGLK